MLYAEHTKAGKELQRRIAKLKEENKDPSLPQKPFRLTHGNAGSSSSRTAPQPLPSPPPHSPLGRLSESQQTVDESFMLLGQRVCRFFTGPTAFSCPKHLILQSEPGDAFNHFWKITEGMLEYLSQPVAFATAPLAPPENASTSRQDGNVSSDTDVEDAITKTFTRGIGFVKAAGSRMLIRHDSSTNMSSDSDGSRAGINTFPPKPQPIDDDWDDEMDDGKFILAVHAQ